MKNILFIVTVCFNVMATVFGANILVFLPSPYHSHTIAYKPLFKELALRGHNVTFYTLLPFKENIPNLKQVVVNDVILGFIKKEIMIDNDNIRGLKHIITNWKVGIYANENLFKEPHIEQLIQSTDMSFDLIILETFFLHEGFVILGHKFNAPVVNIHAFRADDWISNVLHNPLPLSYVPNYRLPMTEHMNFYERTLNTFYNVFQIVTGHYYYLPNVEKSMKKYAKYPGSENLPPLLDLLKNTSLTLLDGNPNILFSSPSIPSFIPVGGIHIAANNKLPEDLENFINESDNGVIYLCFGSFMRVSEVKPDQLSVITKVLGSLPQRVLLKWETDEKMPGQPANVMTSKWFPQVDILAHPKCRAFITHGGFHSVLEAAYFGVPFIGMPFGIDQESNLLLAKNKGFGLVNKFEDLSVKTLSSALNEVLNNPSYKKNAESLSGIIRDVPMSPLETAVFWIEHVLRHKGAEHLQIAGRHLPWYQYYLIDVIFTALAVVTLFLFICYKLIMITFNLILRSNKIRLEKSCKSKKSKRE